MTGSKAVNCESIKLSFRVSYNVYCALIQETVKEEEMGRQRNQRISLRALKGSEKPLRMDKLDIGNYIISEA